MRLRRLITRNELHVTDFDNRSHTAMVFVGTIRNGANKLLPTHFLAGGWHYRADLVSIEGLSALKLSGVRIDGTKAEPLYFPVTSLKSWQEWTKLDAAEEQEWHDANAKAEAAAKAKRDAALAKASGAAA